jgi:hypothetical protein
MRTLDPIWARNYLYYVYFYNRYYGYTYDLSEMVNILWRQRLGCDKNGCSYKFNNGNPVCLTCRRYKAGKYIQRKFGVIIS